MSDAGKDAVNRFYE